MFFCLTLHFFLHSFFVCLSVQSDAVTLEIETHLRCSTDREEGAIKTAVIGALTRALVGVTVK